MHHDNIDKSQIHFIDFSVLLINGSMFNSSHVGTEGGKEGVRTVDRNEERERGGKERDWSEITPKLRDRIVTSGTYNKNNIP